MSARKGYYMKLLILGNSLTHHSPAPQIGWTGDWGMAASAPENDFAHRLCAKLEAAGKTVDLRIRNVAEIVRTPPAPVACDDTIGVAAADGQTGLTQLSSTGGKVLVGGSQIDGHG